MTKFVAYYRVSTRQQGASGLGLEAQRATVEQFIASHGGVVVDEFTEVASGTNDDRCEAAKAIRYCRMKNATLLVAKLDRLARSTQFMAMLKQSGVKFVIAENPSLNDLVIHIMAGIAENEATVISDRIKAALQAKRARGGVLGNAELLAEVRNTDTTAANMARVNAADSFAGDTMAVIEDIRAECSQGASLRTLAAELNGRGFTTARGGEWTATSVNRVLKRIQNS